MRQQSDYWSAWMAGWMNAAKLLFAAQQGALRLFFPPRRPPRRPPLERPLAATAGDKPSPSPPPRRNGRPPKPSRAATPRQSTRAAKSRRTRS